MHRQAASEELEGRGVYRDRRRSTDGLPIWYAVNSQGNEVKRVKQLPGVSADRIVGYLWGLLDARDPLPDRAPLALVKDEPFTTPRPLTAEQRAELARQALEDDPVRRMVASRKRLAAKGQLPRIPRFPT